MCVYTLYIYISTKVFSFFLPVGLLHILPRSWRRPGTLSMWMTYTFRMPCLILFPNRRAMVHGMIPVAYMTEECRYS